MGSNFFHVKFMATWFEDCEGLTTVGGKRGPFDFIPVSEADKLIKAGQGKNKYFRLCPMRRKPTAGRGKAHESILMPGFWLDIDTGFRDNGKHYFPTIDDAWKWVDDTLRHWYWAVINSGGGLHVYFKFDEPEEPDHEASMRFQHWMASICPYDIDITGDLARVLRVPGSFNESAIVDITHMTDVRIAKSDLMDLIPDDITASEVVPYSHCKQAPKPMAPETMKKIDAACANSQPFNRVWIGKYKYITDQSPSGYCLSLANRMLEFGFSDDEIVTALEFWRVKHEASPKPPGWYLYTLKKAKGGESGMVADVKNTVSGDDTDKKKESVSKILGKPLKRVVERRPPVKPGVVGSNRGDSIYALVFEGGSTIALTPEQILSPVVVSKMMMNEFRFVSPVAKLTTRKKKDEVWLNVVQMILDLAEVEDDADDSTPSLLFEQYLQEYLAYEVETLKPAPSVEEMANSHQTCIVDGRLAFKSSNFRKYCRASDFPVPPQIGRILKTIGCDEYRRASVRMWLAPRDIDGVKF